MPDQTEHRGPLDTAAIRQRFTLFRWYEEAAGSELTAGEHAAAIAACGAPAVAAVNRAARYPGGRRKWRPRGDWWAYCAEHAYGRWVENGQVMHWVLRPVEEVGNHG